MSKVDQGSERRLRLRDGIISDLIVLNMAISGIKAERFMENEFSEFDLVDLIASEQKIISEIIVEKMELVKRRIRRFLKDYPRDKKMVYIGELLSKYLRIVKELSAL